MQLLAQSGSASHESLWTQIKTDFTSGSWARKTRLWILLLTITISYNNHFAVTLQTQFVRKFRDVLSTQDPSASCGRSSLRAITSWLPLRSRWNQRQRSACSCFNLAVSRVQVVFEGFFDHPTRGHIRIDNIHMSNSVQLEQCTRKSRLLSCPVCLSVTRRCANRRSTARLA